MMRTTNHHMWGTHYRAVHGEISIWEALRRVSLDRGLITTPLHTNQNVVLPPHAPLNTCLPSTQASEVGRPVSHIRQSVGWSEWNFYQPPTCLGIAAAPNVSWIVIQYLTSTVTDLSSRQWILRIHDDPTRFEGRKTVLGARFMSLSVCVHVCIHIYIYIHMYGIQYNIHYSYVSSPEDHWIKIIEQRSLLSIPKLLPSSWVT